MLVVYFNDVHPQTQSVSKIHQGLKNIKSVAFSSKGMVGYCTSEIKMRIVIAKEAFNRKLSLLTDKQTLNSGRNWLGVKFRALLYMAQRPGH